MFRKMRRFKQQITDAECIDELVRKFTDDQDYLEKELHLDRVHSEVVKDYNTKRKNSRPE